MLYSGSLISGAFSGLIAAGITGNMDYTRGLRAWRWLFLIEGSITIAIACFAIFILPNFPRTTSWLSEEEKQLAAWRLEEDIGEDDWVDSEHQSFLDGAKQAALDIKTWILMVLIFCIVSSGSVTNFFPTVVETLNYGKIETLLLTAPPYALAVITTFLNAWHADRTGERYFHVTIPPLRLRRGVHHRSRDDQHGAALSVDDADGPGHVLGLCGGARLDLEHAATPAGEACCCARGHQRRQQHEQYLCQLHVSAERGTTICGRHVRQLHDLLHRHRLRHHPPLHPRAVEQEARPRRGGRGRCWQRVPVLAVIVVL